MPRHLIKLLAFSATTFLVACLSGCVGSDSPRVVLVPPIMWVETPTGPVVSDLIKIGPEAYAKVYVFSKGEWQLSSEEVRLPEGYLLVPPPPHSDKEGN